MNTPAADGVVCGAFEESFCFHNHAPEQLTRGLAFHQQAADQLGGDDFGGAAEEGVRKPKGGRDGYGCGLGWGGD